jgi:hypothetical protein
VTDDFRTRLEKEVAALDPPPLGDLVRDSLNEGRGLRRRRRWYQSAVVAVAGLAVAGALLGVQTVSQQGVSEPAMVEPVPSPTAAEARVEATPEALLAALLETLPAGKTSNYAGLTPVSSAVEETPLTVQTYLDNGKGPGMLRLSVWTQDPSAKGENEHQKPSMKSRTQPDGDVVTVMRLSTNCIQSLVVWVERPDGTIIQLNVANCLSWDGEQNAEGRRALTEKQAIAVADDPRLGTLVPERFADEGAERFPDLPAME